MSKPKIDEDVTRKIAHLARLRLSPAEITAFTKDLGQILGYVEQLGEVNTDGVEAVVHGFPLEEHFREDKAIALGEEETRQIVACSDAPLYDQFRVPQMIGGES